MEFVNVSVQETVMNKVWCPECMRNCIFPEKRSEEWNDSDTMFLQEFTEDRNICQLILNQLKVQMVVQEINVWKNKH